MVDSGEQEAAIRGKQLSAWYMGAQSRLNGANAQELA